MLATPWGVGAPSSGKSWIRHCNAQIVLTIKNYFAYAPVYNNAVTTEAFINLTVIYDIKITQGKMI